MQGFNRYFPPDFDWRDKNRDSFNKAAGKAHALGKRANKIDQGILTTRFELPYNLRCFGGKESYDEATSHHIGMGVRYNAEKRKVGNYYTTPIFAFRCKCAVCGSYFEIQTDPKNTRYVVNYGAKAQAQDLDADDGGHLIGYTDEGERAAAEGDAFASFEKASTSKKRALTEAERLHELEQHNEDKWSDPYVLNRDLRKALRADKGKRREVQASDAALADKYSLGSDVRLDLVRGEEEQREDAENRAAWLSTAVKKSAKSDQADAELWRDMQKKRRRVEVQAVRSVPNAMPLDRRRLLEQANRKKPTAATALSQQLRANAIKASDPFGTVFSSDNGTVSALLGSLIKARR